MRNGARAHVGIQQLKLVKAVEKRALLDLEVARDDAAAGLLMGGVEKQSRPPVLAQIRLVRKETQERITEITFAPVLK